MESDEAKILKILPVQPPYRDFLGAYIILDRVSTVLVPYFLDFVLVRLQQANMS